MVPSVHCRRRAQCDHPAVLAGFGWGTQEAEGRRVFERRRGDGAGVIEGQQDEEVGLIGHVPQVRLSRQDQVSIARGCHGERHDGEVGVDGEHGAPTVAASATVRVARSAAVSRTVAARWSRTSLVIACPCDPRTAAPAARIGRKHCQSARPTWAMRQSRS